LDRGCGCYGYPAGLRRATLFRLAGIDFPGLFKEAHNQKVYAPGSPCQVVTRESVSEDENSWARREGQKAAEAFSGGLLAQFRTGRRRRSAKSARSVTSARTPPGTERRDLHGAQLEEDRRRLVVVSRLAVVVRIRVVASCMLRFQVMDPHRLAEERSVAYHRAIAERLRDQPEILESARRRVQAWASGDPAPFYARKWAEVLAGDASSVAAFLVERSELADELRQSSPFAGALQPQERWRIWRETRDRFQGTP
jgi:hypothetical protein